MTTLNPIELDYKTISNFKTENIYYQAKWFLFPWRTGLATGHFDWSGHPEILAWFEKMKGKIPNYEKSNGAGATDFGEMFKKAVAKEWF